MAGLNIHTFARLSANMSGIRCGGVTSLTRSTAPVWETITSIALVRVVHALMAGPGNFSSVCGGITSRSWAE